MDASTPTNSKPSTNASRLGRWSTLFVLPLLAVAVIGASRGAAFKAVEVLPAVHVSIAPAESDVTEQADATLASFETVETEALSTPAALPVEDEAATKVTGPVAYRVAETILMEVTAYCPCTKCCGPKAHGVTASGKSVRFNNGKFVAADTSLLPFGSTLRIPGYADYEVVEVTDRGGAIKGRKLDVFYPTHAEALRWGRQILPVQVLERVGAAGI